VRPIWLPFFSIVIASNAYNQVGRSTKAKKSFTCDAAKVWNNVPDKIRTSKTLTTAKKAIREHCKHYPFRTSNTIKINA
jgi:hypothetical protein